RWGSPFVPGPTADWVKGKETSHANIEFLAKEGTRLNEKYRDILGIK
ncbi:MAG: hypothetical protein HY675_00130, partial [Chloroflexi bacterium]|nr:hypothetical protein [Chloroflexota bacterium]